MQVFWGLHADTYIPANMQGVESEAGWLETWAPAIDPWSKTAPGNWPVNGCGLDTPESQFEKWALHVFYQGSNEASVRAKTHFVDRFRGHDGVC